MDDRAIDWEAIDRLRRNFLEGAPGTPDYWRSESDLESYDQTFARRIGWKWDYVLAELVRRRWSPPPGDVLDWGCGSGAAGRTFLGHFGAKSAAALVLWDRSRLALEFAAAKARQAFPDLPVRPAESGSVSAATLLVSHVLTELTRTQIDQLAALASRATAVLWVEPGTHAASRALGAVRERLRGEFHVVAPCTHAGACGLLAPERGRHWCHHFAPSPPEAFTDGGWARFAKMAGVDLRSLPLAFLVLDKRPPAPLAPGAVRIIGRPRVYKGHALAMGCDGAGVRERRLAKRMFPQEYRAMKRGDFDTLRVWECDGDDVTGVRPPASREGGGTTPPAV